MTAEAPDGWDAAAARSAAGQVMQSTAWARIKEQQGWQPEFLRFGGGLGGHLDRRRGRSGGQGVQVHLLDVLGVNLAPHEVIQFIREGDEFAGRGRSRLTGAVRVVNQGIFGDVFEDGHGAS